MKEELLNNPLVGPDYHPLREEIDLTSSGGATAANQGLEITELEAIAALDFATETTLALQPVAATTVTEYNITCTVADTEYSQALPATTKRIAFKARDYASIRFSFVTGKVATPTAPYSTLDAGQPYDESQLNLSSKTLYVASSNAGDIVELVVFS